jgi:methyl-accepting chemotaxis protein
VQADASALAANETATALGETAAGVQRIAESSSLLAERSLSTQADSAQGVETASAAVAQMHHVSSSVDGTAQVIQSLEESSSKISAIIEAIAAITKQTNLLALNASIEAARSGEHGRGFNVVAQEIRKLSEQSKASADEIAEIIGGIIAGTKEAASSMDRSKAEVHRGIGLVNEAGLAFNRILEATESLAEQIHEVSAITQEISASTEQVTASSAEIASSAQTSKESIGSLSASSKDQLDTIQQIAESASQLSELAIQLQRDMDKFHIG